MRFNDVICGLEETCLAMHHSAELAQWDTVAALDRRRAHLLAAMGSVDEHVLTATLREKITRIVELDQQIIQLIRTARAEAKTLAAREAISHDCGAAMYEHIRAAGPTV